MLFYCQVNVLASLYKRQREEKMIKYIGFSMCFLTQILWACSKFVPGSSLLLLWGHIQPIQQKNGNLAILPAFVYLFRISLSVIYASLVLVSLLSFQLLLAPIKLIILSLFTTAAVILPIITFILDLSNVAVNLITEIFNLVVYLLSVSLVWFWIKEWEKWQLHCQDYGVLGRREFGNGQFRFSSNNKKSIPNIENKNEISIPKDVYIHKCVRM